MLSPSDEVVTCQAKPLPILLLLDVSGSMSGVKIDTLNKAVRQMVDDMVHIDTQGEVSIAVSIVTFGSEVRRQFPFTDVGKIRFADLEAHGGTPLGTAIRMAKAIIEDTDETPKRAYRPLVILASDGRPGDSWKTPLEAFVASGRSAKCDRMALAIGADADKSVLGRFIAGTNNPLFEAHSVNQIKNFFKYISETTQRKTERITQGSPPDDPAAPQSNSSDEKSPTALGEAVAPPSYDGVDDGEDEFI